MTDRIHIWHYILKEDGTPIENADIRLYLNDDPSTEANIYANENSSTYTTCRTIDLKTDNDGFVELWGSGDWETGGYAFTQLFRLEWHKAGYKSGVIEDYNPWPNTLIWRDTNNGSDRNYRNKFISDYLANKWISHTSTESSNLIPSASPHNIFPVDYESGCTNNTYNKVVSNKFLNEILQYCYLNDTYPIPSGNTIGYMENITSWSSSGSNYYKQITHPNVNNPSSVLLVDNTTYEEIIPIEIIFLGINTTLVYVKENNNMTVVINGNV